MLCTLLENHETELDFVVYIYIKVIANKQFCNNASKQINRCFPCQTYRSKVSLYTDGLTRIPIVDNHNPHKQWKKKQVQQIQIDPIV